MKLWLISQEVNADYDTYDSAVVVAATAEDAVCIHPGGSEVWAENAWRYKDGQKSSKYSVSWAAPANVTAILVGDAATNWASGEVVCASFNAG